MQRPTDVLELEHRELTRVHGIVVHAVAEVEGRTLEFSERWSRRARSPARSLSTRDASFWMAVSFTAGAVLFIAAAFGAIAGPGADALWVRTGNLIGATIFSVGAAFAVREAWGAVEPRGLEQFWATVAGRASMVQGAAAAVLFQAGMVIETLTTQLGTLVAALNTAGSVGFVISSYLYLRESWPSRDIGTVSAAANLLGSALFLLGSGAGLAPSAEALANWSFLIGSAMFAAGGLAAFKELDEPARSTDHAPQPRQ
ncbi:YrhK family protein [Ruania suaedae]|uniref:YrhK family protein n=1 Tax=Ruania suaedae TaxID=2897774 RepID=UPI001E495792|nr:YrhK family protein [Ruania suaedae]UFU02614.1 YrhK family protein [Ruania suaedae]